MSNLHVLVIGAGESSKRWSRVDEIFRTKDKAKRVGVDIVLRMQEFNSVVEKRRFADKTIMEKFEDIEKYIHRDSKMMTRPGSGVYTRIVVG